MIVVLEIATIAPVNRLSTVVQPSSLPAVNPSHAIRLVSTTAVMPAVGPTRSSVRSWNSSPSENISRITPKSERVCTISRSATSGMGRCGPTIRPARR